ncbi:MAG: class I SAM-dependent methyltransferase [Clostridiales bacterium]|jgi:SAM-dependent methyltransferase|nr:class I SAM-dependent methyltransferase [Clostridiales bacterium]
MDGFKKYWARQFGNPTGLGGKIAAFIMNRINKAMYEAVVEHAPKSGKLLDVGFGNGELLKRLTKTTDAALYGADISGDMVALAKKRNKKAVASGRLALSYGSADAIPFAEQFDFVYTVNTVYFWQDLNAGLVSIKDKLKDGGVFLNVVYTKAWLDKLSYTRYGFAKYTPDELKRATAECGFDAEVIPIIENKSYAIKAVKRAS